jgi:acetate---CoA ligase (ADP-forming)
VHDNSAMSGLALAPRSGRSSVDVILRDGRTLRLRPPQRVDVGALVAFFAALSPESRYMRFHGAISVEERHVERFVDPDWDANAALIGTLGDSEDERVVALASWTRLRDARTAEVAFAVADELQGHGLGTRLLEQLAASAGLACEIAPGIGVGPDP